MEIARYKGMCATCGKEIEVGSPVKRIKLPGTKNTVQNWLRYSRSPWQANQWATVHVICPAVKSPKPQA